MGAIIQVLSYHGIAGASANNITQLGIHMKRADNDAADLSDPIPIPTSGEVYGWRKHTKISVVSGLVGQIGNIRWFAEDAPEDWANSVKMYAGMSASYAQGSSSDNTALVGGLVNVDTLTVSAPLQVTTATNSITGTGTGTQPYVTQQMGVLSTATSGLKGYRRAVYRFDEV